VINPIGGHSEVLWDYFLIQGKPCRHVADRVPPTGREKAGLPKQTGLLVQATG